MDDNMVDGIGIYPNPSSEEFFMDLSKISEPVEISILDCTGKMIETKTVLADEVLFGANYLPGIYLVIVRTGTDFRVFKIVKQTI